MALKPVTRQEQIIAGKNLEPITRMERFLKEYGGGTGGSVQSDWNQTDSSAADFIKNKPFGYMPTVIFEDSINLTDDGAEISVSDEVNVGDSVIVEWNGTEYHCVAVCVEDYAVVGNGSMLGLDDTGEPFVAVFLQSYALVNAVDPEVKSASVKITKDVAFKLSLEYYCTYAPLYIDLSDANRTYLYVDAGLTTKATKDYVIEIAKKAPIIIYLAFMGVQQDGCYYPQSIFGLSVPGSYDAMKVVTSEGAHYTAEYVPES